MPSISVRGLVKRYGALAALNGVDLDIERGEVFSLLGPNGAGKTTMVEILEGYRRRSAGHVDVLGMDPEAADGRWRSRIGIVLQNTTVFDTLTVDELVSHFATFYPAPLDTGRVIGLVGLEEKRHVRCAKLSGGQKRRVDLALGLVGDPELMFLDEPTTGLDPQGRRQLWDVVREFARLGKTVVLTTHYLEEAEALASRVGVIIAGELVEVGAPMEIGGRARGLAQVRFSAEGPLAGRELPPLPGAVTGDGSLIAVGTASPTEVVKRLAAWAKDAGVSELPGLAVTRPSLEDVYLAMVKARTGGTVESSRD